MTLRPSHRRVDHPARHARAGVAGGLRGVVVRRGVHDHRAAGDVVGRTAAQRHAGQVDVDVRHALRVGGEVVHVTGVVGRRAGASVRTAGRVKVAARAAGIGGAAVALLVHVDGVGVSARLPGVRPARWMWAPSTPCGLAGGWSMSPAWGVGVPARPCGLPVGLKWPPALLASAALQSPFSCTWMAWVCPAPRPPIWPVMCTPSPIGAIDSVPLTRLPEADARLTVAELADRKSTRLNSSH